MHPVVCRVSEVARGPVQLVPELRVPGAVIKKDSDPYAG